MRDLTVVLAAVQMVIPASECDLHADLNRLKQTIAYSAPELVTQRWNNAALILNSYTFAGDDRPWVLAAQKVFAGNPS